MLKETIQQLENEAVTVKEEKASLELESKARQEEMNEAIVQLRTELSNKSEEMNMLKDSFGSLLADKEGMFYRREFSYRKNLDLFNFRFCLQNMLI